MFDYHKLFNEWCVSYFRIPYGEGDEFEVDGYDRPASGTFCNSLGIGWSFSLLQHLLRNYTTYQFDLFGTANILHVQLLFKTHQKILIHYTIYDIAILG